MEDGGRGSRGGGGREGRVGGERGGEKKGREGRGVCSNRRPFTMQWQ